MASDGAFESHATAEQCCGRSTLPVTRMLQPQHVSLRDFALESVVEVKTEQELSEWEAIESLNPIEVSSSSSDSDDSMSGPSASSCEGCAEPERFEPPEKNRS